MVKTVQDRFLAYIQVSQSAGYGNTNLHLFFERWRLEQTYDTSELVIY